MCFGSYGVLLSLFFFSLGLLESESTNAGTAFLWIGVEHVVALLFATGQTSPQLALQAPRTADVEFLVSFLQDDLQVGPSLHHVPVDF